MRAPRELIKPATRRGPTLPPEHTARESHGITSPRRSHRLSPMLRHGHPSPGGSNSGRERHEPPDPIAHPAENGRVPNSSSETTHCPHHIAPLTTGWTAPPC